MFWLGYGVLNVCVLPWRGTTSRHKCPPVRLDFFSSSRNVNATLSDLTRYDDASEERPVRPLRRCPPAWAKGSSPSSRMTMNTSSRSQLSVVSCPSRNRTKHASHGPARRAPRVQAGARCARGRRCAGRPPRPIGPSADAIWPIKCGGRRGSADRPRNDFCGATWSWNRLAGLSSAPPRRRV